MSESRFGPCFSAVRVHADRQAFDPASGLGGNAHRVADIAKETARALDVDGLEAEARDAASSATPRRFGRPARGASAAETALVSPALHGGETLDAGVRRGLEPRFGASLSHVRVHNDARASSVARALGARAWAYGDHIGLGPGGERSLAHEAAHVVQQQGGPPALLADGEGVAFNYSVRIDRMLTNDELVVEFLRQYLDLATIEQATAARDAGQWRWTGTLPAVNEAAVRRGYVLIHVRDRSLVPTTDEERGELRQVVAEMDDAERGALHAEVDRRFWERTQYRPGQRLGESRDDRQMAEYWHLLREGLVRTREQILALPAHVREILFDPRSTRQLTPAHYETALRVGQRLAEMSAVELADWKSRITAVTDDWAAFERSLEAYLAREAERRQEQLELGELSTRIYGLEDLYALRKLVHSTDRVADLPASDEFGVEDPTVIGARLELPDLRARYAEGLRQNGFANDDEFVAAIRAWRSAFERETLRIADVLLDRLDHQMFVVEQEYGDQTRVASLERDVTTSGARGHYATAAEASERAIWRPSHAMDEGGGASEDRAIEAAFEAGVARREGEAAMQTVVPSHPIVGLSDFPRERLGSAPAGEAQSVVFDYIADKREAIRETRAELHDDRDFLYQLDDLLTASMEAQGIGQGSIYQQIIQDYIDDQSLGRILSGIVVAIIALALTVLSLGAAGPVAAGAGVAAFGLSAWQAVDAFREYMRESNAHDAELLSEDPSIGWLVLAVVGAAADLGAAAAAIRPLRTAAQAFNVTGDAARFRRAVEAIPALDARVASAASRAADAEAATLQQWRALGAIGNRLNNVLGAGAEGLGRLVVMAWHLGRRGVWRFDQYLAELQRFGVIADATGLSTADVRALRGTFEEGLRRARLGFLDPATLSPEVRAVLSPATIDEGAAFGRFLGLDDDAVRAVLDAQVAAADDVGRLSVDALHRAMRERAGLAPEGPLVRDVRGLPESGTRVVGNVEQAYEIGVGEGRLFLERRGWRQWAEWINPFEFNGRYGQGLDDVFLDDAGRMWVVEYKGGTAGLAEGQMGQGWVRRNIRRLRDAGYEAQATRLQNEFDAGTLRGMVISTPHGEAARVVQEFQYYP